MFLSTVKVFCITVSCWKIIEADRSAWYETKSSGMMFTRSLAFIMKPRILQKTDSIRNKCSCKSKNVPHNCMSVQTAPCAALSISKWHFQITKQWLPSKTYNQVDFLLQKIHILFSKTNKHGSIFVINNGTKCFMDGTDKNRGTNKLNKKPSYSAVEFNRFCSHYIFFYYQKKTWNSWEDEKSYTQS